MNSLVKFLVYMLVALIVFIGMLIFTLRSRPHKPIIAIMMLALIVVAGGMTFARIMYGKELPWWIFYGIPAFVTFVLPPLVLRMNKRELSYYFPLAIIMAPLIHIFFSFSFGWHDYMPLFYVPWWKEIF